MSLSHFDPLDYGAQGDGRANDAASIQKAIDACHQAGGGTVVLRGGRTYSSGSIQLRSYIHFHLEPGAKLIGRSDKEDYVLLPFSSRMGVEMHKRTFIYALDAEQICLSGMGEIDGNAHAFSLEEGRYIHTQTEPWRPAMCVLVGCRRVTVKDVTLRRSANWTLHFAGCEDVTVSGVRVLNDLKFPNCDGIAVDHSKHVRISDCHIEAGDDGIVLKTLRAFDHFGTCENIAITNCTIISTSAAIKIGTESVASFRNIVIANCIIQKSHRGIAIQLRDEGHVENVLVSNCLIETRHFHEAWWGAAEPIYITAYSRDGIAPVGTIRGVHFSNVRCRSENGIVVAADHPGLISDIGFERVRVELLCLSKWDGGLHDRRPCAGPGLVSQLVSGFWFRHVQEARVVGCSVVLNEPLLKGVGKKLLIEHSPGVYALESELGGKTSRGQVAGFDASETLQGNGNLPPG